MLHHRYIKLPVPMLHHRYIKIVCSNVTSSLFKKLSVPMLHYRYLKNCPFQSYVIVIYKLPIPILHHRYLKLPVPILHHRHFYYILPPFVFLLIPYFCFYHGLSSCSYLNSYIFKSMNHVLVAKIRIQQNYLHLTHHAYVYSLDSLHTLVVMVFTYDSK